MRNLRKEVEEILSKYYNERKSRTECYFSSLGSPDRNLFGLEMEQIKFQATDQILQVFEEMLPKEKSVNQFNLSPHPDIINDFEVKRQGFNDCLAQIRERMR